MAQGPFIGMSQHLAMRQEMIMTPQMIQSMELLQLPVLALEQRISQELAENPALEIVELEDENENEKNAQDNANDKSEVEDAALVQADETLSTIDRIDYSLEADFEEPSRRSASYGDNEDDKYNALYNTAGKVATLQEHLVEQLFLLNLSTRQRTLVERIIYCLDDAGYLRLPLSEVPDPEEPNPPTLTELEQALETVQSLDPQGIGARSAKECLLLQIKALGKFFTFEYELVEKNLEDLADNRLPKIAKERSCTIDEVKDVAKFLRSLNPHPGLDYGSQEKLTVVPDLSIIYEEGSLTIKLNKGNLPELRISASCQEATRKEKKPEVKNNLRDRLQNADWIIRAIEQRNQTLLNVSRAIVERQRDFFTCQVEKPGPLMMQEVADEVGVDISTVSRAVKEKCADTTRGLVWLRNMFTRSVGGGISENLSNVQIMNRIKQMIEEENPEKPIKDGQIVEMLKREGIKIVRRTVAKYRQNLDIPSHTKRRQY